MTHRESLPEKREKMDELLAIGVLATATVTGIFAGTLIAERARSGPLMIATFTSGSILGSLLALTAAL